MTITCETCGQQFERGKAGKIPRFCSDRCRKASYAGTCIDCGKTTNGSAGPGKAPERCVLCNNRHAAKWTPETIIAAIQRFAQRYGRPPTATDFNPWHARNIGHPEAELKWQRFFADGDYPRIYTVHCVFGTWNAAIEAAGFKARGVGDRLSDERKRALAA